MAKLEIRSPDGRSELRKLSRRSPLIVGRNPISDVSIDDASVAPVHCRLSWNGKSFEIAAVAGDGVDVNGVLVRRKELSEGDVIRVGDFDLVLVNGSAEQVRIERPKPGQNPATRESSPPPGSAEISDADLENLSQGEIEIPVLQPVVRPRPSQMRGPEEPSPISPSRDGPADVELEVLPVDPPKGVGPRRSGPEPATPDAKGDPSRPSDRERRTGIWSRIRGRRRPGEQEAVRSPLVLGLGGLALLLLLTAAATWLLIGREGANRLYEAATANREARRFTEAIAGYEQFLKEYPRDARAAEVRFELGRTRVERYTAAASPDWDKAVAEFDRFAREHRDEPDFDRRRDLFLDLAVAIASGAAADATRTGSREALASVSEGRSLFDRYAPPAGSKSTVRDRLTKDYEAAEAAVRKREYFDDAAKAMEAAISKQDLTNAFVTRSHLLTRYPDLASNKRLQTLLASALDAEKKLVEPIEPDGSPSAAGGPSATGITIVGHTQARAGEVSDGRLIFAVARDALFGLDAVTGRPLWRQPIGLETPFIPLEVDAVVPAVLAFDSERKGLGLFAERDGKILWRSAVGTSVVGPPLVSQGQIDLALADGRLLRLSLTTGEPLAAVTFPQGVVGPPVLTGGGERLVLFGDRATAYTLDLRSLAVRAVSFTGQPAGSIAAPPTSLGRLVLTCENDRLDSALLRAFSVDADTGTLRQVAAERIEGVTREPMVARGNILLVPSSPERITAFSVSDDPGRPPLTRLSSVQIPDGHDVPTYLVPGPEGLLWEAGSALRKLRLGPDGFELLPGNVAPGRHVQPPQQSGESLFVARSVASSPAIYVSQADREAMTGTWRTVIGASVLATTSGGAVTAVTDAGQTAVIRANGALGFIDSKPLPRWDEASREPLRATSLGDGRVLAWRGGPTPLIWMVRPGEEPSPPRDLPGPPECIPVALDGGLVVPLSGRLHWVPDGGQPVEPFLLPVGGEEQARPKWRALTRVDGGRLAALDDTGDLRLIGVRPEPTPHLAELAATRLDTPTDLPVAAVDGKIVVVIDREVRFFDPDGLRPLARSVLDASVSGGPWPAGTLVFVQTVGGEMVALNGEDLEERWRTRLDAPAAGSPIRSDEDWVVASQTGTVVIVGPTGKERSRVSLGETLTGMGVIGGVVRAFSIGGTILPVTGAGPAGVEPPSSEPSR